MERNQAPPPSASDRELVVAFKSGDGQAYDEIYRRHSPMVRVVCSRRLGHAHDAEEAVQETFLRAFQALPRFNSEYKLGAWLNRIAINICIDQLRSRPHSEVLRAIEDDAVEAEDGPDEIIAGRRPEVLEALREIKPLHANALRLRAVHGLSHEELAAHLEITPAQVKSLLHRARLAFKRVLREASGFVLAPLAVFKRVRKNGHALTAGGGTVNAVGVFTAVQTSLPTAERLMTGAVVAALAIGSGSPAPPPERDRPAAEVRFVSSDIQKRRSFPVVAQEEAQPQAKPPVEKAEKDPVAAPVEVELPVETDTVQEVVEPTTERVSKELDQYQNGGGNEADLGDPDSPDPASIGREIERRSEEVETAAAEVTEEVLPNS